MSSEKQIMANRRNSLRSTGPKTARGKSKASRNALKHGIFSKWVLLSSESAREFNQLRKEVMKELAPEGALEALFADMIFSLFWRLHRVIRWRTELMESAIEVKRAEIVERCRRMQPPDPSQERLTMQEKTDIVNKLLAEYWKTNPKAVVTELDVPLIKQVAKGEGSLEIMRRLEVQLQNSIYRAMEQLKDIQDARRRFPVLSLADADRSGVLPQND